MRWILLALLSMLSTNVPGGERRMAITFDDLPWTSLDRDIPVDLLSSHQRLMAAIEAAEIPLIGFVNEYKLEVDGAVQAARVTMLEDWLDLGAELGNHTYAHVDLHAVGLADYQADILRGEAVLRPLLAQRGQQPRYFRHPYLRAGRSEAVRAGLAAFLAEHGYRVAPVTVDSSEWIWARAYRQALAGAREAAELERLRVDYVDYMLRKIAYYERQAAALFGRDIPQILLVHANRLNADTFPVLIERIRARGYRMVDLDQALTDSAYSHADGYNGPYGPSWIHRWALAEGKTGDFFGDEPRTPGWVMTLAGVESE